jgi:hypothetical protein
VVILASHIVGGDNYLIVYTFNQITSSTIVSKTSSSSSPLCLIFLACVFILLLLLLPPFVAMSDAQQGVFETYLLPRPNNQPSKQTSYLRFDHEDSSVYATPPEVSLPL